MKFRTTSMAGLLVVAGLGTALLLVAFTGAKKQPAETMACATPEKACVFKTMLGMEPYDTALVTHNRTLLESSINRGLVWMAQAQADNGGWGSGSHQRQDIRDPHAVHTDPATTALVGMALLRNGNTLTKGTYAANLKKALNYLLNAVESTPDNAKYITQLTNTQPQTKLGRNIDAILTSQFFTNMLHEMKKDDPLRPRIEKAMNKCVAKIQQAQDTDGGFKDGGWAPVLQSALANNALESARDAGGSVSDSAIVRSQAYQKSNYDHKTNAAVTGKAAGVLLYSVSGSARGAAKDAQMAEAVVAEARKKGKVSNTAKVNRETLEQAGLSKAEADKLATAYEIRTAASKRAQDENVLKGFGNNGGEEFVSFLMTGESLIISGDNSWKNWFEKTTGRLMQIQTNDGSWQGHHCITSPVFCTATCLLILSIDKNIDFLVKMKP
ncbi:MAG TPA: hypothetical protein VD996_09625 [Chitinophagaceae bacterium]|nr:hypothetical protein [Chitinophagaceae bacterium]